MRPTEKQKKTNIADRCKKIKDHLFARYIFISFIFFFTVNPLFLFAEEGSFRGEEFFFAFLPNSNTPFNLEIHAVGEPGTEVHVQFANENMQTAIIPSSGRVMFTINEEAGKIENWQNSYNGQGDNMAIRIEADSEILCYAVNGARASADGAIILPLVELKTFYEVITYDHNDEIVERDQAVFAIVAPYDNTEIIINPSQEISNQILQNPNGTYSVTLNKNEAFLVRSKNNGPDGNLSGSIVKSNYPVGIINGNRCTRIPGGIPSCDHIFEMAQPIQSWGKTVLVAGSPNRPSGMSYEIVALHPNTDVSLDGQSIGTITNNNRSIKLDKLHGPHLITANEPIFVSQFMPGSITFEDVEGDPAMTNISPVEQFAALHNFITPDISATNPIFTTNQITLYVHESDRSNVTVDDITIDAALFEPIPGTSYITATLPISPGRHVSASQNEDHGLIVSGYGNANSYAFPAGDSLLIINKGHDNRAPHITSELINHAAHGTVRDDSSSEDSNNNGLLDPGEDLNNNGKMDEDYGLAAVYLADGSDNIAFVFTSPFSPGESMVSFEVQLIDPDFPGRGTIIAVDLSGNRSEKEIVIPECSVSLLNPSVVSATLQDSVTLSIFPGFRGDDPVDYTKTMRITNGLTTESFEFTPNTTTEITIALMNGSNEIIIRTEYLSPQLQWTTCDTSFEITRVIPLACESPVFIDPQDTNILSASGLFTVQANVTGGYTPETTAMFINLTTGDTVNAQASAGLFTAEVPLEMGSNTIRAVTNTTDIVAHSAACSADIEVFRPFPFQCTIEDVTPANGFATLGDSIDFNAVIKIAGGIAPYQDSIFVKDQRVNWNNESISQKMPLQYGNNIFNFRASIVDAYGQPTFCTEEIVIIRPQPLTCTISSTTPADGFETLDSLINIEAIVETSGGLAPIAKSAFINGEEAEIDGNKTSKAIPLAYGLNEIPVQALFTDSLGQSTRCDTTIRIIRPLPLTCAITWINQEDQSVTIDSLIQFKAAIATSGGLQPFTAYALINGDSIAIENDTLETEIKLGYRLNAVQVKVIFEDKLSQETQCDTSFVITRVTQPKCDITTFYADAGTVTLDSTASIRGEIIVSGGLRPIISSATLNGDSVTVVDGMINTEIGLRYGDNPFDLRTTSTDAMGQETTCDSTITITRVSPLQCTIDNLSHTNGLWTTETEVDFSAIVRTTGGITPIASNATINGEPVELEGNRVAKHILLEFGSNEISMQVSFSDSLSQTTACDTTLFIHRARPLQCEIVEFSPADSAETSLDSITVAARVITRNGLAPILSTATINGEETNITDGNISQNIFLQFGVNEISLRTHFIDSLGQATRCDTTITVFRKAPIECEITEVFPNDGMKTKDDSVLFTAQVDISGGLAPIDSSAILNGEPVQIINGRINKNLPLHFGNNEITLQTFFTDSLGQITQCDTTISVLKPAPPTCSFDRLFPQNGYATSNQGILFEASIRGSSEVKIVANTIWLNDEILGTNIYDISKIININLGNNALRLSAEFEDELGQTNRCETTINVFRIPNALTCDFSDVSPRDGYTTAAGEHMIEATINSTGGLAPVSGTALMNGEPVQIDDSGKISKLVILEIGENEIDIQINFTDASPDSLLQTTQCDTTITIRRINKLECFITDVVPTDGLQTADAQITFSASVGTTAGLAPIEGSAAINGETVPIVDGKVSKVIELEAGDNSINLQTTWIDSLGQTVTCDTTITVKRVGTLECFITDTAPKDGLQTADSQITFSASVGTTAGLAPIEGSATINGETVPIIDGKVSKLIELEAGDNSINLQTTWIDSLGQTVTCDTTITVKRVGTLECFITDIAPKDGLQTAESQITFSATVGTTGGLVPTEGSAAINGETVPIVDGKVNKVIELEAGDNPINLQTTWTDSLGQTVACDTTVVVTFIKDPECTINILSPQNDAVVDSDSMRVTVSTTVTGGNTPFERICVVNNMPVHFEEDADTGTVTIPLSAGMNDIVATSTYKDTNGKTTSCNTTITITRRSQQQPPTCIMEILSVQNGDTVRTPEVQVKIRSIAIAGVPAAPFVSHLFSVNDSLVNFPSTSDTLTLNIPVSIGQNQIEFRSVYTDSLDRNTACSAMLTVIRPEDPPVCEVRILSPQDGEKTENDSLIVSVLATVSGGKSPITASGRINGLPTTHNPETHVGIQKIPLLVGKNGIVTAWTFTDSLGRETHCSDSINVERMPAELLCELSLFEPADGQIIYTDSILVMGAIRISGGVAPYDTSITINDLPAQFNTDGSFYSKIPLNRGENRITAIATITDVAGQHHNCSNERLVIYPEVLSCTVSILQPEDSLTVNTDSMLVIASANVTGGVQPYVDSTCTINGIPASIRPDGFLQARLPVQLGLNKVAVTCAFTDSVGTQTSCSDTLTLIGGEFACELTIISPEDGHKQCSAHFNLYLDHRLRGAIGNPETWCVVNGDTAEVTDDGLFHAHTVLAPGYNAVLINCTSIDSLKRRAVCLDTLTIFVDRTPAIGELERSDPPTIRGRVYDWESGIQSISIVSQRDADLHIDEFEPGQKQVNFVAYRTGENSGPSFMLRVVNGAGCVMEYDPISVRIEPPDACEFSFTIPQADRYLNIDNYGVHKIHMQINELQIDFIADEQGTDAPGSAYFIPLEGARTIDILNFLQSGDNALHMWCEGPAGSYAEIFIADVMLSRQTTAVEMENRKLAALPTEFTLNQNYPNPFNMRTIISFAIPPGWNEPVKLVLYNANGQLVKTLFNEKVPPGNYRVWWDGRDNNGHEVASGMYLYRIISGRQALVKKLLLTK